jgi:hypothetical protein
VRRDRRWERRSGATFSTGVTNGIGTYCPQWSTGERRSVAEWYRSR